MFCGGLNINRLNDNDSSVSTKPIISSVYCTLLYNPHVTVFYMHIDAHTFIYICRRLHYQKSCCDFLHTFSLFLGLFCFNEWESVSLSVKWRRQTDKKKDKDGGRSDEHKEPERTDAVIKGKIVHVMRNCYRMWQCQWVRRVNSECFEILREQKGLMDGVSSGVIARLDKWLKAGCRCCDNQDCAVQSKGWCGGFLFWRDNSVWFS